MTEGGAKDVRYQYHYKQIEEEVAHDFPPYSLKTYPFPFRR